LKSRASLAKRIIDKDSKPVNYTLNSQKITFEFLKAHLWGAADILRGSLDPSEYRQPVMTLLFLKRLNDTFEENAEKLIKQGKNQKDLLLLQISRRRAAEYLEGLSLAVLYLI